MLMMRSTAPTKMAKPPPPVPPRPSKDMIAEALAKTRKMSPEISGKPKPTPMARSAPPPPPNKPSPERLVPVPAKDNGSGSRTVVFQSCPMKTSKIEVTLSPKRASAEEPKENGVETTLLKEKSPPASPPIVAAAEVSSSSPPPLIRECSKIDDSGVIKTSLICNRNPAENVVNTLIDEMCMNANNNNQEKKRTGDEVDERLVGSKTTISISTEALDKICNDDKESETGMQERTVLVIETLGNGTDKAEDDRISTTTTTSTSGCSTGERRDKHVKFDDKKNHEYLIAELENMKKEQERIMRRQRKPSLDITLVSSDNEAVMNDCNSNCSNSSEVSPKILHSDWVEVDNGKEVRLTSCQITIDDSFMNNGDDGTKSDSDVPVAAPRIFRSHTMSSLHGLPPLPKSLSGFNILDGQPKDSRGQLTPSRSGTRGNTPPTPGTGTGHVVYPPHPRSAGSPVDATRKLTNLDTQLAILRREMYGLRQLDLSLLSQLWSLNEAIQDFRQMLQDQEESALSPPSPSPSSGDDGEGDEFYTPSPMKFRPAPPPPPLRRPSNSSSATSSEYGVSLQ